MGLLSVRDLGISFSTPSGMIEAVNSINFTITKKEVVGLIGESGCGKSITALSILRLLPIKALITRGQILFDNINLIDISQSELRKIRGNDVAMIFQEPMTSLNPVLTIARQVEEPLVLHHGMPRAEAKERAIQLLKTLRIPSPNRIMNAYPHNLSGGMRQRVMIAMALLCKPKLLIADEPTTALDVTIQAQILSLIRDLTSEMNMSMILITHDFGVIAEMASRVLVMYAGRIVEEGSLKELLTEPLHPYTKGLLECLPRIECRNQMLKVIPGSVPSLGDSISGCKFHPRCDQKTKKCCSEDPPDIDSCGRRVKCWLYA